MGRKANDGRGRLGGRAKGTPNKPREIGVWAKNFVVQNIAQFEEDFSLLDPQQRAAVMATLIGSMAQTTTTE